MQRLYILIILAVIFTVKLQGEEPTRFIQFAQFAKSQFDITVKLPKDYVADNKQNLILYAPNINEESDKGWLVGTIYCVTTINKDCNSKILYPYLSETANKSSYLSKQDALRNSFRVSVSAYQDEIYCAINNGYRLHEKRKFDPSWIQYITKYGGEQAKQWGNADSVYVVDFPMTHSFEMRYTHCIGIYMAKNNFVPIFLKLMLTDEGYTQREKLLKEMKDCMTFGNGPWKYDKVKVNKEAKKYGL